MQTTSPTPSSTDGEKPSTTHMKRKFKDLKKTQTNTWTNSNEQRLKALTDQSQKSGTNSLIDTVKELTKYMIENRIYFVKCGEVEVELKEDSFRSTKNALEALENELKKPKGKVKIEDGVFGLSSEEVDEETLFHSS